MGDYKALIETSSNFEELRLSWWDRTFSPINPGSVRGSILTFCSNAIGAGLLSLAYAVKLAGIIPGVCMLVLGCFIYRFYYRVIVRAQDKTQQFTFIGMIQSMFGETSRRVLEICLCMALFGFLCAFQALSAQYLTDIFLIFSSEFDPERVRKVVLLAISLFIHTPLVIPKRLSSLRYASAICIFSILYIAFVLVVQTPSYLSQQTPEIRFFKLDSSVLDALNLTLFAYDACTAIPMIYEELHNRSFRRMSKVIDRSLMLSAVLYISIGLMGYISLGEATPELITDRDYYWGELDWWMIVAKFMIASTLVAAISINMNPLRLSIQQMVFGIQFQHNDLNFYLITYFCLYASTSIAILVPKAIVYFKFLGGIFVIPVAVLVPGLLYLKLPGRLLNKILVSLVTLSLSLVGLYSACSTIL